MLRMESFFWGFGRVSSSWNGVLKARLHAPNPPHSRDKQLSSEQSYERANGFYPEKPRHDHWDSTAS